MKKEVTDDEVLRVMSECGMDASNLLDFRSIRHFLGYGMPNCCIVHQLKLVEPRPRLRPEDIQTFYDDEGILGELADFELAAIDYFGWAAEKAEEEGVELWYTPCPACVLSNNFIQLPEGCSCCHDREEHPEPAGDSEI